MARDRVKIWYDVEGDDSEGNVLGFSVLKVSAIRTQPLDVAL